MMIMQRMTLPYPLGHADDLTKDLLAKGSIASSDLHSGNCIHPACLRASLEQSLVTLNLEAVRHNQEVVSRPSNAQCRVLLYEVYARLLNYIGAVTTVTRRSWCLAGGLAVPAQCC
jgi:hypothetical protein